MTLCQSPSLELTEAFTLIGVLLIAAVLYVICTFVFYIKSQPKPRLYEDEKKEKKSIRIHCTFLTKSGFIFFILILVTMVIEIISVFEICSNNKYHNLFTKFIQFIFLLQINFCLLMWYLQMYDILLKTKYKISKCVTTILIIIFIISISFICIDIFLSKLFLFSLFSLYIYIFECIFLSYLFLYKLCKISGHSKFLLDMISNKIYKNEKRRNDRLIDRFTKIATLYFTSLILSVLSLSVVIFLNIEFLTYFVILLDIFSNFILIILSYIYYEKYYQKICQSMHKSCILASNKCVCCFVYYEQREINNMNNKKHQLKARSGDFAEDETKEEKSNELNLEIVYSITPVPSKDVTVEAQRAITSPYKRQCAASVSEISEAQTVITSPHKPVKRECAASVSEVFDDTEKKISKIIVNNDTGSTKLYLRANSLIEQLSVNDSESVNNNDNNDNNNNNNNNNINNSQHEHHDHQRTETEQMEDILEDILGYDEINSRHSNLYRSRDTTANNSENETEVP